MEELTVTFCWLDDKAAADLELPCYRCEIKVALVNLGDASFTLYRGDRMAQLVVSPVVRGRVELAGRLDETARGGGGFGHTGR